MLRDIFTHKKVTHEHWQELMLRPFYAREDLSFERWGDPNAEIEPEFDPNCDPEGGKITNGCEPTEIISADKLLEFQPGPQETARVANALKSNPKTGDQVIPERTWNCIWSELIQKKKGPRTIRERPGGMYYSHLTRGHSNLGCLLFSPHFAHMFYIPSQAI